SVAYLRAGLLVVAQQRLVVALEILGVQIAVHVEESALQRPGGFELSAFTPALAATVQAGQHQAIVLRPAQPPVDLADIILVVRILFNAEVLLVARREAQRAAAAEAVIEFGLYIGEVQRPRVVSALAVGLMLHAALEAQVEGAAVRTEQRIAPPEQTRLE